ncbi:kinesin-like protein KIN-14F [Selaginella moellendorffii]|nr:kinesin-like protein KIN-14F [Selaginella moellendorffii]|eukprot:XP_002992813.2 kinesin-like protein KIN-14F [Selaginella moellendorffii]
MRCAMLSSAMHGGNAAGSAEASRASDEHDRNLTVVEVAAGRVSDVHMASRKAEEAATRRFQAASWINKIVGCSKIPSEPSEDELRLCLRNGALLCRLMNRIEPGSVSKVVETTSSDGSLSAFQCFENLRNFLVASQEMRLPTFESSDLEQATGSMTKVVDCILALKSYNEWKQTGALGSWKYAGSLRSPLRGNVYPRGYGRPGGAENTFKKNSRKRLLPPDNYVEAEDQPVASGTQTDEPQVPDDAKVREDFQQPPGVHVTDGKYLKSKKLDQMLVEARIEIKSLRSALEIVKGDANEMQKMWKTDVNCLENQQDLKGNIRVYCRVRPSSDPVGSVEFIGENGEIMIANKELRKSFCFNRIFGPRATQESVYLDTQPLIRSVLDGYNVCIFAYGQTGSGKTYTMSGPDNLTEETWGVNYRALHDLFKITTDRKNLFQYEIVVQFLEIYNEHLRDLLTGDSGNKKLEIRNCSQKNGINVPDATMMPVNSTADVLQLMKLGQKNRSVGSTAMNERSSRSHSVLTVHVRGKDLKTGAVLHGSLHLVDLAGSERVDKSEATGERLKEAQYINKSLAALGDVIAALSVKSSHVPYRNSKLTQLLQDSLGGQAKALMFVHMSPDIESFSETLSTLKFAERVATVELGAARTNRESGEVRDLKDQVMALKEAMAKKDAEIEKLKLGLIPKTRIKGTPLRGLLAPEATMSAEWHLTTEDSSHSSSTSPDEEVFESCLSTDSGKDEASCPELLFSSSPSRPTPKRILQEKVLNAKAVVTTSFSGKPRLKPTELTASQKLLRKSAYLRGSSYLDQNLDTGGRSPASIRKPQPGPQWRTPLQPPKLKASDPRLSCGDQFASSRRYSNVGVPADCSSVKRSSLGSKESSQSGEGSKPAFARHLFANPTSKPTKRWI